MGTGEFAVPPLTALIASRHNVAAVVSQPDRPKGRGLKTESTPVKHLALKHGISVLQPASLRSNESRQALLSYLPEIVVVVSYGLILPDWNYTEPPLGAINIHGSLLPAYRGAAPIQRAIMNGETHTGVTILKVAKDVDTGDILMAKKAPIDPIETAGELSARLSEIGAVMLNDAIDRIESGKAKWTPQPEAGTDAPKIKKTEAKIDWKRKAIDIINLVRGLNPSPGAYFICQGKRVKLWHVESFSQDDTNRPGTVIRTSTGDPVVMCGRGALVLLELQPEGKNRMTGRDYLNGYNLHTGDMLE